MKICVICGEEKPLDEFGKNRTMKDGRRSNCKVCHSREERQRYREEPRAKEERAARRAEIEKVRCLYGQCMRPGTYLKQGFGFRFCDIHAHYARKILDNPTRSWSPAGYALPTKGTA